MTSVIISWFPRLSRGTVQPGIVVSPVPVLNRVQGSVVVAPVNLTVSLDAEDVSSGDFDHEPSGISNIDPDVFSANVGGDLTVDPVWFTVNAVEDKTLKLSLFQVAGESFDFGEEFYWEFGHTRRISRFYFLSSEGNVSPADSREFPIITSTPATSSPMVNVPSETPIEQFGIRHRLG